MQRLREGVLWKVDGLSERQARWPMVPTGTNLLGLVKHLACVAYAYLGTALDRLPPEPVPWWDDDAEPNADMWATAEESRDDVLGLYRRARAHSDRTIAELALDEIGHVPWWPTAEQHPTLHTLMVTVVVETSRHAGHADILGEQIDGRVGLRAGHTNMPSGDAGWWASYHQRRGHRDQIRLITTSEASPWSSDRIGPQTRQEGHRRSASEIGNQPSHTSTPHRPRTAVTPPTVARTDPTMPTGRPGVRPPHRGPSAAG